ncbi:MAG: hypothetical protein M0R34_11905 [Candidatus Marinimicrobia bacterium]|jgi:hypothetical protein|nr:hypothetical protein [Candidatus Neomarinimicrobiota bacterium]MCK9560409.1 hypothetical protein [Candidatus Neomarinimicrobiota bacterium]MDD5062383.1 hypothetical protein [Candidatus Neomarinimicrobiota bacterium]MDD5541027.1 hypothetical protein [Candidatus Neomarinimicrobiota bacterium]
MKKTIKIFVLSLVFASLLFGAYLIGIDKGGTSILSATATAQNFNTVLATCLEQLEKAAPRSDVGKIIINVDGTDIVVLVKIKDLQKLTHADISFDQFVRTYLKFS